MDSLPLFIKGFLVGIMVAAPMGPVNILCIHRTITRGRVDGFLTGMGAAVGDGVFALAAALGLTAVAAFVDSHEAWFRIPGGVLLLVMSIFLWRSHPHLGHEIKGRRGLKRNIAATFVLTISNPITLAAFFSFFVAWGLSTGFDLVAATNVVAGVFAGSAAWWLALVLLVGLLHGQIKDYHLLTLNRVMAVMVLLFGLYAIDSVTTQFIPQDEGERIEEELGIDVPQATKNGFSKPDLP